ncbi:MAG: hypothetical protein NVS3B21_25390 [Acidimicrobiales bacterium]
MNFLGPNTTIREHLGSLASALGGDWALVESSPDGVAAISTSDVLAAAFTASKQPGFLSHAPPSSIVLEIGRVVTLPGGTAAASGLSVTRRLVGQQVSVGALGDLSEALLLIVGETLNSVAEAAACAKEHRRREERLELRASTDPLTGLFNRRGWDQLMVGEEERCRHHGLDAEIVIVDLDSLKSVNDVEGHEAGDALILRAATFIFSAVRSHDAVARLGGDEFGVLAVGAEPGQGRVGDRIRLTLEEADIAASVGWADRNEAGHLAQALRQADINMYRAKQQHRKRKQTRRSDQQAP